MGKISLIAVLGLAAILGLSCVGSYNKLVRLSQAVDGQWAQVENAYQRRADLVPNLVETVKGAAKFEKDTLTAVTEARAKVGQMSAQATEKIANDPAAFERFQQAQDGLSSALSRLLVVSEKYPELKATQSFRDLQVQLEGTENRIAVERMRFNEAAQEFNTDAQQLPDGRRRRACSASSSPRRLTSRRRLARRRRRKCSSEDRHARAPKRPSASRWRRCSRAAPRGPRRPSRRRRPRG